MSIAATLSTVAALTLQDFQRDGTIVAPRSNKGITFVMFYLPYCRICQETAVSFAMFGQQNTSAAQVAAVDVTSPTNLGIITHLDPAPFALSQFPTIVVFWNGWPCSVFRLTAQGDIVSQLSSALAATQRGCGSCTLSACSVSSRRAPR